MTRFRRDALELDVVLHSRDDDFVFRLEDACRRRGHRLIPLGAIQDLARVRVPRATAVILLDGGAVPSRTASVAATVAVLHDGLPVVVAADRRDARTLDGIRIIDKRWGGERLLDEIELAWIGIPGSIADFPQETFARPSRSD